jgi:hypothetical protein
LKVGFTIEISDEEREAIGHAKRHGPAELNDIVLWIEETLRSKLDELLCRKREADDYE